MSLPHDRRQTQEQAAAFAAKTAGSHKISDSGNPAQIVLRWLLPRVGRA
ncbi:MAG TPA: hypothetical protein VM689_16615 [Aliidongia sp.]|nr:hypothetical protein [Aliidongia sp.]